MTVKNAKVLGIQLKRCLGRDVSGLIEKESFEVCTMAV